MREVMPRTNSEQAGAPLDDGWVRAIWLRIEKDSNCGVIYRQGHHYLVQSDNQIDLLIAENGRLVHTASVNDVRSFEEVVAPPSLDSPDNPVDGPKNDEIF